MESLRLTELDWIAALRGRGPWDWAATMLSAMGQEAVWAVIVMVYLSVSRSLGARCLLLFAANLSVSELLKAFFHTPRPYWLDPRILTGVAKMPENTSYGFPSGHAMNAFVAWFYAAARARKPWVWLGAVALVLLVSLGRVYLGVHFISDCVGGWFFGAIMLAIWCWREKRMAAWIAGLSCGQQVRLAISASAAYGLAYLALIWFGDGDWQRSAALWFKQVERALAQAGVILGAGAGLALARRHLSSDPTGTWWQHAGRWALFGAGYYLLHKGVPWLTARSSEPVRMVLMFSERVGMMFWLTLGVPWLGGKLGLVKSRPDQTEAERGRSSR